MSTQADVELTPDLRAKRDAERRRLAAGQIADVTRRAVQQAAEAAMTKKKPDQD